MSSLYEEPEQELDFTIEPDPHNEKAFIVEGNEAFLKACERITGLKAEEAIQKAVILTLTWAINRDNNNSARYPKKRKKS